MRPQGYCLLFWGKAFGARHVVKLHETMTAFRDKTNLRCIVDNGSFYVHISMPLASAAKDQTNDLGNQISR